MKYTEFCADLSIWCINVELLAVLNINVIMIVFMVSDDFIIVWILVGLVVVVSLGS